MAIMNGELPFWEREVDNGWTEKDQNVPKRHGLL